MIVIGKHIKHKTLGDGLICDIETGKIAVRFGTIEKKFLFPSAFNSFLTTDDPELQTAVEQALADAAQQARIHEEAERERKAAEEERRLREARLPVQKKVSVRRTNTEKAGNKSPALRHAQTESESIAFKCNFCDGGSSSSCIGFRGKCSDIVIRNNIFKEKHVWCSTGSICKKYMDGEATRAEVDSYLDCHECNLLNTWTMGAGTHQSGNRAGVPMHIKRIHKGSLAVLTTRKPDDHETDRFIFAVFLVNESYDGDAHEEGSVSADPKWRIELKPGEAERMLFWNYYVNTNKPEYISFGSGLHRYLTDIEAAQILRDIATVKGDDFSGEFYRHFCNSNNIDPERLEPPYGALKRIEL